MKKIIALMLLIMLSLALMISCGDEDPNTSDQSGTGDLNIDVEKLVGELKYQYNMDDYISLPKYDGQKIEIELDDIQRQIDSYIIDFAKNTDRTICMIGDVVVVSYIAYELDADGEILKKDGKPVIFDEMESFSIYLGSTLSHAQLENGIMGMSVGELRDIYVDIPSDYYNSELAGKRVMFDVQLNGIFDASLYTDKFVSENFDNYKTKAELENSMLMDRVYEYISENAIVKSYPEKEYTALVNELKAMEESFEKENGVSLDKFIKDRYGMTREEYIKKELKGIMIIYALAQKEKLSPSDEELIAEKKELVAYYTSYYKSRGMSEKEAIKSANDVVNDLGKSYLFENIVTERLNEKLLDLVEIEQNPATYKSVTVELLERAQGKIGKELDDICLSFDAEVFDENGSLSTTLNPSRNVGSITVIYFWNNTNGESTQMLNSLDKLASEYESEVTVYAIHCTSDYGSAPDYIAENFADSEIMFLKDYTSAQDGNGDVLIKMLSGATENPYMVILDKNGVIKGKISEKIGYDELVDIVSNLNK